MSPSAEPVPVVPPGEHVTYEIVELGVEEAFLSDAFCLDDGTQEVPDRLGRQFLSILIRYHARADEIFYDRDHWNLYWNGDYMTSYAYVRYGDRNQDDGPWLEYPELWDGYIDSGKTQLAWLIFEVPRGSGELRWVGGLVQGTGLTDDRRLLRVPLEQVQVKSCPE